MPLLKPSQAEAWNAGHADPATLSERLDAPIALPCDLPGLRGRYLPWHAQGAPTPVISI